MEPRIKAWTGSVTRQGLAAGVQAVVDQEAVLNQMNVFPIPDRDTGTNLRRTLEAGLAGRDEDVSASGQVLEQFARSALIHSRGNSGAIFAEILRGFADAARDQVILKASDIRLALRLAADYAYQAVSTPAEGTILTAVRAAADALEKMDPNAFPSVTESWAVAAQAAHQATHEGPRWLSILAEHGVVDAAALGFSHFLQGLAEIEESPVPPTSGYEVQYLLTSPVDRAALQVQLGALGHSLVVSGGRGFYRVHIHTMVPDRVLEEGRRLGVVEQVTTEKLDPAHRESEHAGPREDYRV